MAGYKEIADALTEEIATGVLPQGAPVPSLHTICREYKVSYMTAVHVHEELARRGLIIRNPAFRKTLVGGAIPEKKTLTLDLKKIVLIHNIYPVKKQDQAYSSDLPCLEKVLKEKCSEKELAFESIYNKVMSWTDAGKFIKELSSDTAYILAGSSSGLSKEGRLRISSLIAMSNVPAKVFLDHIVPSCHCVVYDYASCVESLVKELKKLHVREIMYLRKSFALGNYYSHIRYISCKKACEKENIVIKELTGSDYSLLLDFVKENGRKKAIVCPQDTVADNCRMFLEEKGVKEKDLPVITGMDCVSFAKKLYPKFSVKFDMKIMAEKAFSLAVNSSASDVIHNIEEIPGRLIFPEEWEKERRKY